MIDQFFSCQLVVLVDYRQALKHSSLVSTCTPAMLLVWDSHRASSLSNISHYQQSNMVVVVVARIRTQPPCR